MQPVSVWRITRWSLIFASTLGLCLVLRDIKALLSLNQFRPRITQLLETTGHCHALIGNVRGELFPRPGLIVGHVVLLQESSPPRILASLNGMHLWFSYKTLFEGRLRFDTIRLAHPRFILHREQQDPGDKAWTFFALPTLQPVSAQKQDDDISVWQIRDGQLELWDHTIAPTAKWVVQSFSGDFYTHKKVGALAGKAPRLGSHAMVDVHYDGQASFPVMAHLANIELSTLPPMLHAQAPALIGLADLELKVQWQPTLNLQATLAPVLLPHAGNVKVHGDASYEKDHMHLHLQTDTTAFMKIVVDGKKTTRQWNIQGLVEGYDARLVQAFYPHPWINRLVGRGSIVGVAQWGFTTQALHWTVTGNNFLWNGSPFQISEWSAQRDSKGITAHVDAETSEGGSLDVIWSTISQAATSSLEINCSSVTLHQLIHIFTLPAGSEKSAEGYQAWTLSDASVQATIEHGKTLTIQDGRFNVGTMHLDLVGAFNFATASPQAHIQGDIQNVPLDFVIGSFFKAPSPLTGTANANYDLTFPLSALWVRGLNGSVQVQAAHGVLHVLKTFYRIISVLNLGNYLRLRFPQVTAKGIEFDLLSGNVHFQNGVFSSDDLFLKSPNMNVGAVGSVDIPGKQIKATLRLEMFRFLEDILRDVPITHWIFKKPSKIFLPLVVTVSGPWDDAEIR